MRHIENLKEEGEALLQKRKKYYGKKLTAVPNFFREEKGFHSPKKQPPTSTRISKKGRNPKSEYIRTPLAKAKKAVEEAKQDPREEEGRLLAYLQEELSAPRKSGVWDCIILGAGPAGLMTALQLLRGSSRQKKKRYILLLEAQTRCGMKLLASGGGRCNLLNHSSSSLLASHYYEAEKFLYTVFKHFGSEELETFFTKQNFPLQLEEKGRVFPKSQTSHSVLLFFLQQILAYKPYIELKLKSCCTKVQYMTSFLEDLHEDKYTKGNKLVANGALTDKGRLEAEFLMKNSMLLGKSSLLEQLEQKKSILEIVVQEAEGKATIYKTQNLVVASGSPAYPQIGGNMTLHHIAENFQLSYQDFTASLSSIPLENSPFLSLAGLSFPAELQLKRGKKTLACCYEDLLFTHKGLSGPAAQNMSHYLYKDEVWLEKDRHKLYLQVFPQTWKETEKVQEMLAYLKQGKVPPPTLLQSLAPWKYFLPDFLPQAFKDFLYTYCLHLRQDKAEFPKGKDGSLNTTAKGEKISFSFSEKMGKKSTQIFEVRELSMPTLAWSHWSKEAWQRLYACIAYGIPLQPMQWGNAEGRPSWKQAKVAAGGLSLREVQASNLRCKKHPSLYFCGEVLNIDGQSGGFNLQAAFSTASLVALDLVQRWEQE